MPFKPILSILAAFFLTACADYPNSALAEGLVTGAAAPGGGSGDGDEHNDEVINLDALVFEGQCGEGGFFSDHTVYIGKDGSDYYIQSTFVILDTANNDDPEDDKQTPAQLVKLAYKSNNMYSETPSDTLTLVGLNTKDEGNVDPNLVSEALRNNNIWVFYEATVDGSMTIEDFNTEFELALSGQTSTMQGFPRIRIPMDHNGHAHFPSCESVTWTGRVEPYTFRPTFFDSNHGDDDHDHDHDDGDHDHGEDDHDHDDGDHDHGDDDHDHDDGEDDHDHGHDH